LSYGVHKLTVYALITGLGHAAPDPNSPLFTVTISSIVTVFIVEPPQMFVSILSLEQNKTYNTTSIPLDFNIPEYTSASYNLDEQTNQTLSGNSTLTGLSDGTHSITAYATDTFGNTVSSGVFHFAIDTTPPRISVLSPENRTYYSTYLPLSFSVDELTSQVGYSLDGNETLSDMGNTTLTGLPYGSHNITLHANDTSGNTGTSEIIYFSVAEPFPTTLVATASGVSVAIAVVGLLVYFKKRKH
jgi:hypothetical protein